MPKSKIQTSEYREEIEKMLAEGKTLPDVKTWCEEKGFPISTLALGKWRLRLTGKVVQKIEEKSKQLVESIAQDRLDLARTVDDSIKKLNDILDSASISDLCPENAREYAGLLQAKANLVRAEIEAKGAAPAQALSIIKLIEKAEEKRKKATSPLP